MKRTGMIALAISLATCATAFDAGPHQDLTAGAMHDYGFSSDAVGIARLNNWLVDYYSNTGDFQSELAHLHFDNLPTTHNVKVYWSYLTNNTRRALQAAARANDPFKAISLLGMSLHAVQDFYAHSTWVETHPAPANAYRAETYFTDPPADNLDPQSGLYTGLYPGGDPGVAGDAAKYHGTYFWGVNHDQHNRPRHDEAFVFSYSATVQWIRAAMRWVDQVRVGFSKRMLTFSDPARRTSLNLHLKYMYYLSNWAWDPGVFGETDGRWKAHGSGSVTDFPLCLIAFKMLPDDLYELGFKLPRVWFRELTPGLNNVNGLIPAIGPMPAPLIKRRAIVVRTVSVRDDTFFGLDLGATKADFYAVLEIGSQRIVEPCFRNQGSGAVNWRTLKLVPNTVTKVRCKYQLFEEDIVFVAGDWQGSDDHCDINPAAGSLDLSFTFDVATHGCTGDVVGVFDSLTATCVKSGTESNDSTVRFYITEYPVIEP